MAVSTRQREEFIRGYVDAMLWAETITLPDAETDDNWSLFADYEDGQSFDDAGFVRDDIDAGGLEEIEKDCDGFLAECERLIDSTERFQRKPCDWTYYEQAGHDFYLTRNGHGVGFWDRGYPQALGDALTSRAKGYGTQGLYLGDDRKCYVHG